MVMRGICLRMSDSTEEAKEVIGEFVCCNMMMIEGARHFGGWPKDIFFRFVNPLNGTGCTRIRRADGGVLTGIRAHIDSAIIAEQPLEFRLRAC
jgi:hypothetical protein